MRRNHEKSILKIQNMLKNKSPPKHRIFHDTDAHLNTKNVFLRYMLLHNIWQILLQILIIFIGAK